MSINWQHSRIHSLNKSSSKSMFAFEKSPRFQSTLKPLYNQLLYRCDTFYNITQNINNPNKGITIPKPHKLSSQPQSQLPSPHQYQIPSTFALRTNTTNQKTIKLSKLKYPHNFHHSDTPNPGYYQPRFTTTHSGNRGYTIGHKLK